MTEGMGIEEAIELAIQAELNDHQFYKDASEKVSSGHGKDMLRQLANFEISHYNKLMELRDSLKASGAYVEYAGTEFGPVEKGEGSSTVAHRDDVLNILKLAINAEEGAYERYNHLASVTDDPKGKNMFVKLAAEEELHRRILSDQFYQISNKGAWVWGR